MFHVRAENARAYADDIDRYRPDLWIANPSPLARLARDLDRLGWRPTVRPRGIWSMAEELLDADREAIEHVFGCRVTNTYGMTEMAVLAAECRHGTLHISDAYGRTETLDAPGGLKELVGTSWVRTRVPVVRYRTGDLCESLDRVDCPCGMSGLAIRGLRGRAVELIRLPGGQVLSASPLADVLRRVPGLVWSSIEVTGPLSWRIHYHATCRDDRGVLDAVGAEVRKRVQGRIGLEAVWESSPVPPGPKPRLVSGNSAAFPDGDGAGADRSGGRS
jgi:phenylacetate-coenzyme A ligase PaaK-like adenylate-forming protein